MLGWYYKGMISRLLYFFGVVVVKIYSKLMFRVSMHSHSPMPDGAKIIVANHPTTSDPFIITSISNGQASILIKDILFNVPLFGRYLKWAQHIPVSFKKGKEAFEQALDLLKKGRSIVVFIEGDISPSDSRDCKPRTGAVRLALCSGVSIVPVGIGVKKENIVLLNSVIRGRKDTGTWYSKGPYAITVGRSLKYLGSVENKKRVRTLSEKLMQEVNRLAEESSRRINFAQQT